MALRNIDPFLEENRQRTRLYFRTYNRHTGDEEGETVPRFAIRYNGAPLHLPVTMQSPLYEHLRHLAPHEIITRYNGQCTESDEQQFFEGFARERFRHDFEYWAYTCVKIQDKLTKKPIPFALNRGQRRLVGTFERQRRENQPIRVILLKARQWGGSTATQIYMLWLQLFHYENWHSAIVTQLKGQAANIRGMITKVVAAYPQEVAAISLSGYEGMPDTRLIPGRGNIIWIGSAENPDSCRSFDFSMVHMSEVGLWRSTLTKSAEDIVQSLYATVPDVPGTLIVMESTAKGSGNFFHNQYLDARNGDSELAPVFVPWFEIEMYTMPVTNYAQLADSLTDYNWWQWEQGATLEGIAWYNSYKKRKRYNDFQMKSEFPTTAEEAFQSNASRFYEDKYTEAARKTCIPPRWTGDVRGNSNTGTAALQGIEFIENGNGQLAVWEKPEIDPAVKVTHRYLVTVDIGGRHHKSDYSVISVFDRAMLADPYGAVEVVATWHGHIDHDLLAWKAAQIAQWYDHALLAIESNTLETRDRKQDESVFEGDHFYTVIDEIADVYSNMYARSATPDATLEGLPVKYGWHMNKRTKYLAYDRHFSAVRDRELVERDRRAVDEMVWLEIKTDGTIGAIPGQHDDIIDTRAVGAYIALEEMPLPKTLHLTPGSTPAKNRNSHGGFSAF